LIRDAKVKAAATCFDDEPPLACLAESSRKNVSSVPACAAHAPIVIVLFSGRRREGDLQSHLESRQVRGRIPVVVLFDLVYGRARYLTSSAVIEGIAKDIRSGHIVAFVAGPPCSHGQLPATKQEGRHR